MPLSPSTCPLDCPDACGVLVETDDAGRFVRVKGNPAHPYSNGALCGKTAIYGDVVTSPDRLLTPRVRVDGELREATWDEALRVIAERMQGIAGERILALSYAGTMGLVQRRFPLRMMNALGAVVTDGALCDTTSELGYRAVYGDVIGADIDTAEDCDAFVLWGCDMARTVQHLQPKVQRLARRGVPVVAVDVYRTDTIRALERWGGRGVLIRPGTDAALALGLARLAYERGDVDRDFVREHCLGGEEFERHVRDGHDLEWVCATTGAGAEDIELLYRLLAKHERPFVKVGVGFTRRRVGAMSMRAVCSLAAVLGHARRVHYESMDCFALETDCLDRPDLRPDTRPGTESPDGSPRNAGAGAPAIRHVELADELERGRFRAVFVWGHNPAVVVPDSRRVRAGLAREDVFLVVHEHFLTETAQLADVVLPATTFVEHADVFRSYGHRYLHFARQGARPPEGPRCNVDAFGAIAAALGLPEACRPQPVEALCEELLAASTHRLRDGDLEALRAGLPVKIAPPGGEPGENGNGWPTPSGKIELASSLARRWDQPELVTHVPDDASGDTAPLWLHCAPSRHTHNSTFSHSSRHVARAGAPRCFLHPDDARARRIEPGAYATLFNSRGELTLLAELTDDVPRGLVRVDGLPRAEDVPERIGVNALVAGTRSDMGDGNTLYSARVDVRPADAGARA